MEIMNHLKKSISLFAIFLTLSLVTLQAFPMVINQTTAEAAPVKLNKKKVTLIKGEKIPLKVIGTQKKIIWKSSNEKIATVSKAGKVTAKKKGIATIKAIIGKKTLKCIVRIETPSINKTALNLYVGETHRLKINGNSQKIKWSSSNISTATVASNGVVTVKKAGIAKITAKIANKKYICSIKVTFNQQIHETPVPPANETVTPPADETVTPPVNQPDNDEPGLMTYVLNTSTKKFHKISCGDVPDILPENREDFYKTRDDAISLGYSPCGHCKP